MTAEDTAATNEHQVLIDAGRYCRVAHPARWEHPANGADRACLTCLDATLAANRPDAATNERETLAEAIPERHYAGSPNYNFGWNDCRTAVLDHLAATQRPDDREALLSKPHTFRSLNGSSICVAVLERETGHMCGRAPSNAVHVGPDDREATRDTKLIATAEDWSFLAGALHESREREATLRAAVDGVRAVLAEHWDWKAGKSLHAAVSAALTTADGSATPAPEATTVTEWALLAADGTIFDGADEGLRWTREQAQYAMEVGGDGVEPDALICRQHTSYADHVTDWAPADGSMS